MGCLFSFLTYGYCVKKDEARAISKQIDKEIIMELKNEPDEIELLLLGACESGKSTFLKQMRLIHQNDYTLEERLMYKPIVYANTIQSMSIILNAVEKLNIQLECQETAYNAYKFYKVLEERTSFSHTLVEDVKVTPDLAEMMAQIWRDAGIKQAYQRSDEYYLPDCASYFLSDVERLSDSSYVPTTQDILHTRVKTSGIVEAKFLIKGMMFRIHDVGGQQSDRRKWLNLFDCVHAVTFCVALTSYDIMTTTSVIGSGPPTTGNTKKPAQPTTNVKTNHMRESLKLFSGISNSKVFFDATMILLLSKTDVFREKIKRKPITVAFPEYTGRQDYDPCIQFISKTFKDQKKSGPHVCCHLMCTTDTNNMRFVIGAITDLLIKNFLKDCGIY